MQITGLIEDVVQSYINLIVQTGQLKSENDQLKSDLEKEKALSNKLAEEANSKVVPILKNVREPDKKE